MLVMGGHAVRYYGIDRNTIDYDFHLALDPSGWRLVAETVREALQQPSFRESHSWRPADFRRFVIGRLADGRDELIEFWRHNHLLPPFSDLAARSEHGIYGGASVRFLGIADLIRSKETEREGDWQDVLLLEEVADARALAREGPEAQIDALRGLRSRRGYELAVAAGRLTDAERVGIAAQRVRHPIPAAFLAPHRPDITLHLPDCPGPLRDLLANVIPRVPAGSVRHLALVEAARRLYKREAMNADRADKDHAAQ